ncbi:MAG: Uncharacterized protein CEN92_416 [Candidatus Berkelbacteria bacterium Licking1014_96]|uniref:Uncharacterized protein n=1 Tax=Candidatus Berkelbacteria bacterium Licking1014_96 TaxID=2017149 RepID=A0A554LCV8_9BACT|nr:MAG: Uncharacterized protein CEN92_416 [Candidatus Berkelbacteria bacterium Licking1014_96]
MIMIDTKKLLRFTAGVTVISIIVFVFVLFRVDPFTSGISALVFFLVILFLALSGLLTFPGYYLRTIINKNKTPLANFNISLRQSILISTGMVGLLILKSTEGLAWWNGLLLIAALAFLEMFFRS